MNQLCGKQAVVCAAVRQYPVIRSDDVISKTESSCVEAVMVSAVGSSESEAVSRGEERMRTDDVRSMS